MLALIGVAVAEPVDSRFPADLQVEMSLDPDFAKKTKVLQANNVGRRMVRDNLLSITSHTVSAVDDPQRFCRIGLLPKL